MKKKSHMSQSLKMLKKVGKIPGSVLLSKSSPKVSGGYTWPRHVRYQYQYRYVDFEMVPAQSFSQYQFYEIEQTFRLHNHYVSLISWCKKVFFFPETANHQHN